MAASRTPTVAAFAVIHLLARERPHVSAQAWTVAVGAGWLSFYAFYFARMSRV